jgi:hypothetical protein
MNDAQIQEAAAAAGQVVGISAYLHGAQYSVDQFVRELQQSVDYIKSQIKASAEAPYQSEQETRH